MDEILAVKHLVKSYKEIIAVNDISFSVKRGSLFAFLGPNGAGKSTTINVITTLLEKDSGEVMINGKTDDKYFREKIGVVFQNNVLDDVLTVKENLLYRGALYLKTKEKVLERYAELAEFLNLTEFENQKFKTLSGGQKRRTEIARALFANPEILLLDEPTTGLDPETRQIVWKVIEQLKEEKGITIFLTTHYMEEAANADHVVIINKGKIMVEGTPAFLKEKYSYDRIKIVAHDKNEFKKALESLDKAYTKIADQFIIIVKDTKETLNLIENLKDHIKQLEVVKGSMDDVFVNVVGKDSLYV
ncbi:MAG: ABC transporter ATP-binding protein [Acholeplasmataceae bacterium]|nr:ABC transporter ATP-binding protein [Acholeplasmataceae bacterium]